MITFTIINNLQFAGLKGWDEEDFNSFVERMFDFNFIIKQLILQIEFLLDNKSFKNNLELVNRGK